VTCSSTCLDEEPWNGGKVRVTAYGKKDGSFHKLKVFQWTAWMEKPAETQENYTMNLKFRGDKWSVVSIDDGRNYLRY